MVAYVKENSITEYCDLVDYAAKHRPNDWFPLLMDSCTYFINAYIKSHRYKAERMIACGGNRVTINPDTGEVTN
jgi:hypothetical protein